MKKYSIILLLALIYNCSKGDEGGTPVPPVIKGPSAATLIFPDNNQECTTGVEVNANESTVTFSWNSSANTDSYDVILKNLTLGTSVTYSANTNEKDITLKKATPYSWYVISKSTSTTETAQSETWKFYNAGDGLQFYAPFPAELIGPTMGANLSSVTTVTLEWTGSDVDNDITGYVVYLDTTSPPTTQLGTNQTETSINASVTAGNTYYWRIITTDSESNNSESEIFEFKVD